MAEPRTHDALDATSGIVLGSVVPDGGQRPLQLLLVVLTFVTGLVDAVTYLAFGHVFAANMTGNIIVLGFALAGTGEISASASVVSLGSFLVGAALSARLAGALQRTRQRWLLTMLAAETALLVVATLVSLQERSLDLLVVALLAVAMGMRTVTVRRLGIADVSTTVLTSTLAGLAADALVHGHLLRVGGVRLAVVLAMLLGAAIGARLLAAGAPLVLAIAALLVLGVTLAYVVAIRRETIVA
jgi:uncharacterized membrane protein YoaK (UPF0700 family)